jgi:hypothetical protein
MTDNVTKFPEPPKDPDLLVGPFEEYRVVVDGYQIPLLTGHREGHKIWLSCDHPRRSRRMTHLCSVRLTHTKNSVFARCSA